MGREVRKVPPNWQHPTIDEYGEKRNQPMFDESIDDAWRTWLNDFDRIRMDNMTDIERECYPGGLVEWAHDNPPPDPSYYRPWKDEEATWFQLWETVSEGTPVSPPFATKGKLAAYLAKKGDFWDQERGHDGWGFDRAKAFVDAGWAPSFVVVRTPDENILLESKDVPLANLTRA